VVARLPDTSLKVVDVVKRFLDETIPSLRDPMNPSRSDYVASIVEAGRNRIRNVADFATGSHPRNGPRTYETARNIEETYIKQHLQPLLDGPLGKLAERDATTQRAIEVLFPSNPLPNSQDEIATAVSALARRSPQAAADLVRAHMESVFNKASNSLQGANQFGGANFAASLVGNPQQRENLRAAMGALPGGDATWRGFERFLEIAQATGTRQPKGSLTSFNELAAMPTGGMAGNVANTGASAGHWATAVSDAWRRWQLGSNRDELVRILTDPQSARLLRAIANLPAASREAQMLAGRAVVLAYQAGQRETPDSGK
jgi:hypothetical protein